MCCDTLAFNTGDLIYLSFYLSPLSFLYLSMGIWVELFFIPDEFCFYFVRGFSYPLSKTARICQQVSLFDTRSALGNRRRLQNHKFYNNSLKGGDCWSRHDIAVIFMKKRSHNISGSNYTGIANQPSGMLY